MDNVTEVDSLLSPISWRVKKKCYTFYHIALENAGTRLINVDSFFINQ